MIILLIQEPHFQNDDSALGHGVLSLSTKAGVLTLLPA
jgi:hypothetical protein